MVEQPVIRAGSTRRTGAARSSSIGHWVTVAIMTGLIITAIIVAIVALAR
jgi:hypothetical protein